MVVAAAVVMAEAELVEVNMEEGQRGAKMAVDEVGVTADAQVAGLQANYRSRRRSHRSH